jgi:60 kDa SS-A/Ro ribonucleoprotein
MVENAAGGYAFRAGDWERLDRFLILGTEGGTYYASERQLTRENAAVVRRCMTKDLPRTVARTVEVSTDGLAPKNSPAILALALAFCEMRRPGEYADHPRGDHSAHTELLRLALRRVCRTGTHLMEFLDAATALRGGGRGLNAAVRAWMNGRDTDKLAFQMTKYRSREGWTWRDILRRFRPKPGDDGARQTLYRWAAGGDVMPKLEGEGGLQGAGAAALMPDALRRYLAVQAAFMPDAKIPGGVPGVLRAERAPWEWVPSERSTDKDVLDALFDNMPLGATVRQLSKLTAHGVLPARADECIARLLDPEQIKGARMHPVNLFTAQKAYEQGKGRHLTWTPHSPIVDALDDAFRVALQVGEPIEANVLIAVDTSGSMSGGGGWGGSPTPAPPIELGAAMALGLFASCKHADVIGFDCASRGYGAYQTSEGWTDVPLSKRMRCVDAARAFGTAGGSTDCSLPFKVAKAKGRAYDAVVVFTDGESWAGAQHPMQAFDALRRSTSPHCRLVWCAMTASGTTLGDPQDPSNQLGICGFSADVPKLISDFVARKF